LAAVTKLCQLTDARTAQQFARQQLLQHMLQIRYTSITKEKAALETICKRFSGVS
jgi:hypothetical protein